MGKRSDFERNPRDFYVTPKEAVIPLLPYLPQTEFTFCEPCAGNGALINHIEDLSDGLCYRASDIEPLGHGIRQCDVFQISKSYDDYYITNPPWDRKILHPLITHLSNLAPTWLLFDADWMHTKQSVPFLPRLRTVVSVGRLKWIPDSKMTGKDNCAWYLFDQPVTLNTTYFYGRV